DDLKVIVQDKLLPGIGQLSDWNPRGLTYCSQLPLHPVGWLLAITTGTAITRSLARRQPRHHSSRALGGNEAGLRLRPQAAAPWRFLTSSWVTWLTAIYVRWTGTTACTG